MEPNGTRWRRSEVISLGTLITLAGWIWYASAKVGVLDETVKEVQEIRPQIEDHGKALAVLVANVNDIKDDLKYLRRHSK